MTVIAINPPALPRLTSFDVLTEPWLPVQFLDGRAGELSLTDVFRRAHECRELTGELPTSVFALTRLLLAVLHRTVRVHDPVTTWAELWRLSQLPADAIADYLTDYSERFDLFHPSSPFLQVARLRSAKDEVKPLEALVADVPSNEKHFTTRAGSGLARMTFGEAARWLVHVHAFDSAGIRTGTVGDPRVKGGKSYPIGTGWAGRLGGLVVAGQTLRETLLLNLVLARDDGGHEPWPDEDLPVWERDPLGPAEERPGGAPAGPADLFTWPSRRVHLVHDGVAVTGVVLSNGDPLRPQNRHTVEPMTAWRRSPNQEKQLKAPRVYMPRTHDPSRTLWRGLPALLPEILTTTSASDAAADAIPPMTFRWLATLRSRGVVDPDYLVSTRAVGVGYGTNESTYTEIIDDALHLRVGVLADRELRAIAVDAVRSTDQAVVALGRLASNLATAGGSGEPTGARDRAAEQAYFDLDRPFRRWLEALRPDSSRQVCLDAWFTTARRILGRGGDMLLDESGPAAWVGREVKGRGINRSLAELWFRKALAAALPRSPDDAISPTEPEEVPT